MKKSQYFADANDAISQNYLSADAWENADDNFESADDEGADDYSYAFGDELEAAGPAPAKKMNAGQSQPYTIVLANTTTTDIANVSILGAGLSLISGYAVAGVTFGYEPTNMTYGEFLANIVSGKIFQVGQLRLIGSNVTASIVEQQVLTSIAIATKDPNGNTVGMSFIPEYDSYQFRSNQTDIYYKFNVDALTTITIATLYAATTLKIRMYPASKINQFATLRGKTGVSNYANPKVNKALSAKK
jgi:hypothetical protein